MIVPNAQSAIVPREKITAYLLNLEHPDGAGKAQFFAACGFRAEDWTTLADALLQLVQQTSITNEVESAHGRKYVVEGEIETPGGSAVRVRSVWIIDVGYSIPRLVTAFPLSDED